MKRKLSLVRTARLLLARCQRSFAGSDQALGSCWHCNDALATVQFKGHPAHGPFLCDACAAQDPRPKQLLATTVPLRRLQRLLASR